MVRRELSKRAQKRLSQTCGVLNISALVMTIMLGVLFLIALVLSFFNPPTASAECIFTGDVTKLDIRYECTTIAECGGNLPVVGGVIGTVNHLCKEMCQTFFDLGGGTYHKPNGAPVYRCPPIEQTLVLIFNWAAIGVSIVVVLMVIIGAIMYMTAAGSQERAKKGIEFIRNAIIALVLYLIMWALLNFLVPGGVFE